MGGVVPSLPVLLLQRNKKQQLSFSLVQCCQQCRFRGSGKCVYMCELATEDASRRQRTRRRSGDMRNRRRRKEEVREDGRGRERRELAFNAQSAMTVLSGRGKEGWRKWQEEERGRLRKADGLEQHTSRWKEGQLITAESIHVHLRSSSPFWPEEVGTVCRGVGGGMGCVGLATSSRWHID